MHKIAFFLFAGLLRSMVAIAGDPCFEALRHAAELELIIKTAALHRQSQEPSLPTIIEEAHQAIRAFHRFPSHSDTSPHPLMDRADNVLANHMAKLSLHVSSRTRKHWFHLVASVQKTKPFEEIKQGISWDNMAGLISSARGQTRIRMHAFVFDHPYSRILLRHEFDHLTRLDPGPVANGEAHRQILKRFIKSPNAIMREEAAASAEEYDYIRATFSLEDLQHFPDSELKDPMDKLVQEGAVTIEGDRLYFTRENIARIESNPDLDVCLSQFFQGFLNRLMRDYIHNAWTLTRDEYIQNHLQDPEYLEQQKSFDALRKNHLLFLATKWGVLVPLSGWFFYQFIHSR